MSRIGTAIALRSATAGLYPTHQIGMEKTMLSVNTNTDAMTALEYLGQTQGQLSQTENAVSTGLTVASAKDNGAAFSARRISSVAVPMRSALRSPSPRTRSKESPSQETCRV